MRNKDKCMDSQLWHACAGGMVQLPEENTKVYYFPQGHAEHAQGFVNFENTPQIPPLILCRVTAVKFMSDRETDEVFAKIQMVPIIRYSDPDDSEDRLDLGLNESDAQHAQVKPVSFAKTLTQSDANNGGGFSVPRYCAETIFPRLDYSANPPLQTLIAKDVHGEVWKFRHIYRGTPRRHLLTTGWGTFVNKKRLVAGDSIVFLKADNGDLCIGIRRARKGGIGYGPETPSQLNLPSGVGASDILREENIRFMRSSCANFVSSGVMRGRSYLRADSVIEAATLAASGHPFEVVYYPRASTPEFCIKAAAVRVATRIQWFAGMRFKMAFETEDSSRISWFMGTISSVQVVDPKRWPDSPWRLLQVIWDEPDLLQNVKCVSPWLVELVSHMPTIDLAQFTPTSKKRRISQHLDCHFDGKIPLPMIHGTPLWSSDSPIPYGTGNAPAAGIKGARHANYGLSLSDLRLNKLQTSLCYPGFDQIDHATPHSRISTGVIVGNGSIHDNVSCLLTIGHPSESQKRSQDGELPRLVLFGQPIFIADELSLSKPEDTFSFCANRNRSSDRNLVTVGLSNDYGSAIDQKGLFETLSCGKDHQSSELGLETGHCKIFMESEDVGRTLDLTVFGSYEELYERLTDMFGIQKSDMMFHVLYKDAAGAVKHTGDQPFSDFMKTARRLTILTDSES